MTPEERQEIYHAGGEYENNRMQGPTPSIITPDAIKRLFEETPEEVRLLEWRGTMKSEFQGRWYSWSRTSGLHGLAMMCGETEIASEVFDFIHRNGDRLGNYTSGCWIPNFGCVSHLAQMMIKGNNLDLYHFMESLRYKEGNSVTLWDELTEHHLREEMDARKLHDQSRDDPQ